VEHQAFAAHHPPHKASSDSYSASRPFQNQLLDFFGIGVCQSYTDA
jgi:hypothetical protein